MDARSFLEFALFHPMKRLCAGWVRNVLMGIFFGVVFFAGYAFGEGASLRLVGALLVPGFGVSVFLWGSFRLWSFTVAPMTGARGNIFRLVTRIPYWFIAGGMGYTLGLLTMKKMGFLDVQDIPVKALFLSGGKFSAGMELVFEFLNLYVIQRKHLHDKSRTA